MFISIFIQLTLTLHFVYVHYSLLGMEGVYSQVDLTRKMTLRLMLYMKLLIKEWMTDGKNGGEG